MACYGAFTNHDPVGECHLCGCDVDEYGNSTEMCEYSPEICEECGRSPCDESC